MPRWVLILCALVAPALGEEQYQNPPAPPTIAQPTPTARPTWTPCCGDCNGDREVTIDELVLAVSHALHGCR